MLVFGSRLIGTPIMGLQTGTRLAVTKLPIIDPSNLKIVAYEVEGPLLAERPAFIRMADVREIGSVGMIIDSNDEFIGIDDVIAIQKLYKLNFRLIGLNVFDETKHKLGKIIDYTLDASSFVIQQLNVRQGIMKSITNTDLLIHRSQIVEINNDSIIVHTTAKKVVPIKDLEKLSYVNPFRSKNTQANNDDV